MAAHSSTFRGRGTGILKGEIRGVALSARQLSRLFIPAGDPLTSARVLRPVSNLTSSTSASDLFRHSSVIASFQFPASSVL